MWTRGSVATVLSMRASLYSGKNAMIRPEKQELPNIFPIDSAPLKRLHIRASQQGPIAQLVEPPAHNRSVARSSRAGSTTAFSAPPARGFFISGADPPAAAIRHHTAKQCITRNRQTNGQVQDGGQSPACQRPSACLNACFSLRSYAPALP